MTYRDVLTYTRPSAQPRSETCPVAHGSIRAAFVCGTARLRRMAAVGRDGIPSHGVFVGLALQITRAPEAPAAEAQR